MRIQRQRQYPVAQFRRSRELAARPELAICGELVYRWVVHACLNPRLSKLRPDRLARSFRGQHDHDEMVYVLLGVRERHDESLDAVVEYRSVVSCEASARCVALREPCELRTAE